MPEHHAGSEVTRMGVESPGLIAREFILRNVGMRIVGMGAFEVSLRR
jgi:hypothetical protein